MMLRRWPPRTTPIVITLWARGGTLRERMVWRAVIACDATTTGSMARSGRAPWAERPLIVMSRSSAAERSEEHTSELQSLRHLVCRLLLEKKKIIEHRILLTASVY